MNATSAPYYHHLSLPAVGNRRRRRDGLKLLLGFVVCVLAISVRAENLIVNGDFEAGQLAPWQGGELVANPSGGLCARVGEPSIGHTLSQGVPTVGGQRYLVSVEARSEDQFPSVVTLIAQSMAGSIDGSRYALAPAGAFQRVNLLFTATSANTFLEISSTALGDFMFVDNVTFIPIPPGADGSYAGTIVTTVTVTDSGLSAKSSRKVTARIDAAGEVILLDGTNGIITGYILPSGEFSLALPDGTEVTGTAVRRGRRIELEYPIGSHAAVTLSGVAVPNTIKQTLVLVRR